MKYIYGPISSRRLGFSLGVSIVRHKTCDFDCVYCQLGETTLKTQARLAYIDKEEILSELKLWLKENPQTQLEYITLSGSGEPCLHINLGDIIREIKTITTIPVAVITNSSLLINPVVRQSMLSADLVVPSLDAASQDVFKRIDRPLEGIRVEDIINALILFRQEFKGRIWLEVMLVAGINDDLRHIKRLKEAVTMINPDKIQLNTPVRHTALKGTVPPNKRKLNKIKEILGPKCEIL